MGVFNVQRCKHWLNLNGIKYDINSIRLGVKLTNMKFKGVYKGRHTMKGDTKLFCIRELKDSFKIGCLVDMRG